MNFLLQRLNLRHPIIQAPMAGVSTPALAAAVTNVGALGSIGVGNLNAEAARRMIAEVRKLTSGPFNVNVFCHQPAARDSKTEQAWLARLAPTFQQFNATPPATLREIYKSYLADDEMQATLLNERPAVVSFHFGLPSPDHIRALQQRGSLVLATATNVNEALAAEEANVDAVVAQGYEAGGHRGVTDLSGDDACLTTLELTHQLAAKIKLPVIAAGGIMNATGIAAALDAGATAVQLGTAFLLCPESATNAGYRSVIQTAASRGTTITRAISGRPARSLVNEFTKLGEHVPPQEIAAYPVAYDAGKALHAAATAANNHEYGAHWAGTGVTHCQALPAAQIIAHLTQPLAL